MSHRLFFIYPTSAATTMGLDFGCLFTSQDNEKLKCCYLCKKNSPIL